MKKNDVKRISPLNGHSDLIARAKTAVTAWVYKHDLIASSIFALLLGLAFGGVTTILDRLLV